MLTTETQSTQLTHREIKNSLASLHAVADKTTSDVLRGLRIHNRDQSTNLRHSRLSWARKRSSRRRCALAHSAPRRRQHRPSCFAYSRRRPHAATCETKACAPVRPGPPSPGLRRRSVQNAQCSRLRPQFLHALQNRTRGITSRWPPARLRNRPRWKCAANLLGKVSFLTQQLSDQLQCGGMRSVPPRGSGWVPEFLIPICVCQLASSPAANRKS